MQDNIEKKQKGRKQHEIFMLDKKIWIKHCVERKSCNGQIKMKKKSIKRFYINEQKITKGCGKSRFRRNAWDLWRTLRTWFSFKGWHLKIGWLWNVKAPNKHRFPFREFSKKKKNNIFPASWYRKSWDCKDPHPMETEYFWIGGSIDRSIDKKGFIYSI